MADAPDMTTMEPSEMLAVGRRHLAVRDYSAAVGMLADACEKLAGAHGDGADECGEAYLWYGKALLGLSREESGVLGDGIAPGGGEGDEEDQDEDDKEESGAEENGKAESSKTDNVEAEKSEMEVEKSGESEKAKETVVDDSKKAESSDEQPGPSNGEVNADESVADLGEEDDVENLQLAWEMLELSRGILARRAEGGGGDAARALLADVHLALGEVALESETYDKAVLDMQSCLEIQKDLYASDDRRIAETHYQIGLANSLSSNFEDAITHFKNAANILETRIKTLESPSAGTDDETVKKYTVKDPFYTVAGEVKELKELLPEIREKIHDMMDYKAETIKRLRETLCPANGAAPFPQSNGAGSSSSTSTAPRQATNISHLVKRKRKSSETEDGTAPKRSNT